LRDPSPWRRKRRKKKKKKKNNNNNRKDIVIITGFSGNGVLELCSPTRSRTNDRIGE
jgi:hypothetical protein